MKKILKTLQAQLMIFAVAVVALSVSSGFAIAGIFDVTQGRVAIPGTELHALGTEALETGLGGINYFTNDKGRVVEVRAKEMANGDLHVSLKRVYIPENKEVDTFNVDLDALVEEQTWIGDTATLPTDEGATHYGIGVMVEKEFHNINQYKN